MKVFQFAVTLLLAIPYAVSFVCPARSLKKIQSWLPSSRHGFENRAKPGRLDPALSAAGVVKMPPTLSIDLGSATEELPRIGWLARLTLFRDSLNVRHSFLVHRVLQVVVGKDWSWWIMQRFSDPILSALGQSYLTLIQRAIAKAGWVEESSGTNNMIKNKPLQILECGNCGYQVRPGFGRGSDILNAPNFRCANCGANASHFFDKDDDSDPTTRRKNPWLFFNL